MKTKTMKKALSLFLAVLMIALALPFTLLTVAAEEPVATTIAGVTSTSNGRTTGGVTYALDWAWDGDLTTTYLGTDASKRYAVTDGVFGAGSTYQDYITVELSTLSNLTSVTIWGGSNKTSKSFTNHSFDVYYSQDGETWTLHSEYSNVCGDETNAGAGSEGFTEERTAGENTYYGLKLEMNNALAKYVRIAIKGGRLDRGWSVLREIDVEGTEVAIPVSVAGIQQGAGGIRLVGVTDSTNAAGVGFKLDATYTYLEKAEDTPASVSEIVYNGRKTNKDSENPHRSGSEINYAFDGDVTTSSQTFGFSSYFPTFYLDGNNAFQYNWKTNPSNGGPGKYYAVYIVELSELSVLEDMILWGGYNKTASTFANDAYDIYYSLDGTSYTAVSGASFTDMTGTGSAAGANSALFSEERTVVTGTDEETGDPVKVTYYGHKIDMNDVEANYVAIAVVSPSKNGNKDAVLREVEVNGVVLADSITVTKTATVTTDATNVVYNSILADGETISAKDIDGELYDENDKLYALGITGIPTDGTVILEVTPYFIPVNSDTKVYGDKASFELIEGKAIDVTDTVKTMTYNINNGQVNDKIASARLDYIAAQINTVDPDIVLLGEAHNYETSRYNIAMSDLTAKCDVSYGIVEFTAEESTNVILYNTEKFTLLKSEYLELGYGAEGQFDAQWKRDAVIAKFKRISDNREILAVATHLSTSNGKDQIRKLLTHVWDNYADVEMRIIAGDLNVQSLTVATAQGNETASNKYVHENSFANKDFADIFYTDANVSANGENVDTTATFPDDGLVIDYIYTTNLNAKNYQVLMGGQASNASDHNAVYAELVLN